MCLNVYVFKIQLQMCVILKMNQQGGVCEKGCVSLSPGMRVACALCTVCMCV